MVHNGGDVRDEELLSRIVQRDESALADLYDRYVRLVYTIAYRITGDWPTAEEVVQDVFHNIWHSAVSFHPQIGTCSTWIISIARHRSIDATRNKRACARAREHSLPNAWPISDTCQPEMQVERQFLRDAMRSAIADLPTQQSQVLELAYYGGLSCGEIAARIDQPLGTVKTRLRLGIQKLRVWAVGSEAFV